MRYIGLFFLILVSYKGFTQINFDTINLVYGPSTTKVFLENDWLENLSLERYIDTSLIQFDRWDFYYKLGREYQDLGNNGTALNYLWWQAPYTLGRRSGLDVYNPLVINSEQFLYYNTKSPHMEVKAIIGGQGRSQAFFRFTQNVNESINIGLHFDRITSDKQIGPQSSQFDRNVVGTQLSVHGSYSPKKTKYKALGNILMFDHDISETGGIYFIADASRPELFQYTDSRIRLKEANASENRLNFHAYHEFAAFKQFQLYHKLDRRSQIIKFKDFKDAGQLIPNYDTYEDYYPIFRLQEDSTRMRHSFSEFENEVGIKGTISSIYYRLYSRVRRINYFQSNLTPIDPEWESFIGGLSEFRWKEIFDIRAEAELSATGEYRLVGKAFTKFVQLQYLSGRYRQPYVVQFYNGNHADWQNNFPSYFSNQLSGKINLSAGPFTFQPEVNFTTLTNYAYLRWDGTNVTSSQISGSLLINKIGGELSIFQPTEKTKQEGIRFKSKIWINEVVGTSEEAFRIPLLFTTTRIFWEGNWFKNTVPIQWGAEIHYQSAYFADGYRPDLQQYYSQNDERIDAFFTIDPFINMRVDKIFVFVKMIHANQPTEDGYFVTPLYPGLPRMIDFGVKWLFFD